MLLDALIPIESLKSLFLWKNTTRKSEEGKFFSYPYIFQLFVNPKSWKYFKSNMATYRLAELEVYLVISLSAKQLEV